LIALPDIDPLNTVAIAELVAAGITDPTAGQIVVRAADIATRSAVPGEHGIRAPEAVAHSRPAKGKA
jgi:hypothetical protein